MSTHSPPRASAVKYTAPYGTRWEREKASAGQDALEFPNDPAFIGPWIVGECVGKGASGRVRIAKHRTTGQLAAVKILPIQPIHDSRASLATKIANSDKQRLGIDREIAMMKLMNHPNIMRIYDVFEGEDELFLVLEYVKGGELFDFLVNRGRLAAFEALTYFKQIIYGLNYAHTFSIIHRDLKPENILIQSIQPPIIKIADWGMAAFAPPTHQLETSCGSPHYASPEIVQGRKYSGTATDIWSCGVILYALLVGRLPFDDKNIRHLLAKVKTGKFEIPPWVDPLATDLLLKMLVVDVNERITIPQIMLHPWFKISTPSIPCSMPPSPGELALPIASPASIDGALLETLRIIWGRQTDSWGDSIRQELLSSPGEGVLAKAFYFLLTRYRDRVQRETDDQVEVVGKHIIKQYVAPSPNYLTFLSSRDQVRKAGPSRQHTTEHTSEKIVPNSRPEPSAISELDTPVAYPQPHPQNDQNRQTFASRTVFSPSQVNSNRSAPIEIPRPHAKFRPISVAPSPTPNWHTSSGAPLEDINGQHHRSLWSPQVREPAPFIKQLPVIAPNKPSREVAPRRSNDRARQESDKENMSVDVNGWCNISESAEIQVVDEKPRRTIRKVRSVNVETADGLIYKEKSRPISTLKPKRSTISLLASPIILSPQTNHGGFNPRSPVVGEVKGWITNLFHRKASYLDSSVLYSPYSLTATLRELCIYLRRVDVIIVEENFNVIKCRVEEDAYRGLKSLRFRAEITNTQPRYSQDMPLLNDTRPIESACEIGFTIEKGPILAFKALFRRLKWEAEAKGSFISMHAGSIVNDSTGAVLIR